MPSRCRSITAPCVGRVTPEDYAAQVDQARAFLAGRSRDVQETFKKKLGADYPRYVILGACNPTFAYQALAVDEQIGLLLPCNVIVYDHEGATEVAAFDPRVITTLHDREEIEPIAREMAKRLERVIAKV